MLVAQNDSDFFLSSVGDADTLAKSVIDKAARLTANEDYLSVEVVAGTNLRFARKNRSIQISLPGISTPAVFTEVSYEEDVVTGQKSWYGEPSGLNGYALYSSRIGLGNYRLPSRPLVLPKSLADAMASPTFFGKTSDHAAGALESPNHSGLSIFMDLPGVGLSGRITYDGRSYKVLPAPIGYALLVEVDQAKRSLLVYPNPSAGRFTLTFNTSSRKTSILKILSPTGRVVLERKVLPTQRSLRFSEDFDLTLSPGVYYATLVDGENTVTQKIVLR